MRVESLSVAKPSIKRRVFPILAVHLAFHVKSQSADMLFAFLAMWEFTETVVKFCWSSPPCHLLLACVAGGNITCATFANLWSTHRSNHLRLPEVPMWWTQRLQRLKNLLFLGATLRNTLILKIHCTFGTINQGERRSIRNKQNQGIKDILNNEKTSHMIYGVLILNSGKASMPDIPYITLNN